MSLSYYTVDEKCHAMTPHTYRINGRITHTIFQRSKFIVHLANRYLMCTGSRVVADFIAGAVHSLCIRFVTVHANVMDDEHGSMVTDVI